jgi:hypothetical protein
MPVVSGLDALKKRIEEAQKARQSSELDKLQLKLKADEIAKIRIWTEAPDVKTFYFHGIKRLTQKGKEFTDEFMCVGPEEPCKYCSLEDADARKTRVKMFLWVYCYYILHRQQAQPTWQKVDRAGLSFYREEINAPRYIRSGEGYGSYLVNKFLAYYGKYKTLCDRDYEWIRQGANFNDTIYDLLPEDPSSVQPFVRETMMKVPALEVIARSNLEPTTPATAQVAQPVVAAAPSAPQVTPTPAATVTKPSEPELPLLERLRRERGVK